MNIETEILQFKIQLLKKMPFYGDIIMRIPFVSNNSIFTARTNGEMIEYNPVYLMSVSRENRNYIIMHELFHILLRHCSRGGNKNKIIWNTAADIIVNSMLDNLVYSMRHSNIPFARPEDALTGEVDPGDTMENVYAKLLSLNKHTEAGPRKKADPVKITVPLYGNKQKEYNAPCDIVESEGPGAGDIYGIKPAEAFVEQIVGESLSKHRSDAQSYFIPDRILKETKSKKLKWQSILKDFLVEEIGDDVSYTTPERKYIHMDLILPGHSLSKETIEEIWAFVDSSGSIGADEMEQFLTQLYRIAKEFKCRMNICYWDTSVTDVYMNVLKEDDVFKCKPRHSGGTNINCVYQWIREKRVKPDVMLILTDGYFGRLQEDVFLPSLKRQTILVLSNDNVTSEMNRIGKITTLV